MKNISKQLTVEELGGQFVVVDRQMWDTEHPTAMRSVIGSVMLAAGPYLTRDEAEKWLLDNPQF